VCHVRGTFPLQTLRRRTSQMASVTATAKVKSPAIAQAYLVILWEPIQKEYVFPWMCAFTPKAYDSSVRSIPSRCSFSCGGSTSRSVCGPSLWAWLVELLCVSVIPNEDVARQMGPQCISTMPKQIIDPTRMAITPPSPRARSTSAPRFSLFITVFFLSLSG
jgi:hypothetical protein